MAGKKMKLDEEAISEILVNQVLRTAILKKISRRKKKRFSSSSRSQNTGCNKWQITNLGTASRKEHKYSSFCLTNKRCEET